MVLFVVCVVFGEQFEVCDMCFEVMLLLDDQILVFIVVMVILFGVVDFVVEVLQEGVGYYLWCVLVVLQQVFGECELLVYDMVFLLEVYFCCVDGEDLCW